MAEECKIYEIEVPDGLLYYRRFVEPYVTRENEVTTQWDLAKEVKDTIKQLERLEYAGQLDEEQKELLESLTKLVKKSGDSFFLTSDEAYIKAYCLLKGHRNALLLWDGGDETWWYVIFDLDEDTIKEVEREIENYLDTIYRAEEALPEKERDEFEAKCELFEGGSPEECLEEARKILSERRAQAQPA